MNRKETVRAYCMHCGQELVKTYKRINEKISRRGISYLVNKKATVTVILIISGILMMVIGGIVMGLLFQVKIQGRSCRNVFLNN